MNGPFLSYFVLLNYPSINQTTTDIVVSRYTESSVVQQWKLSELAAVEPNCGKIIELFYIRLLKSCHYAALEHHVHIHENDD